MTELPLNQILQGDCLEAMQDFPKDSVDLVVTSPPFWGLRDYGEASKRIWDSDPECTHEWGPLERGKRKDVFPLDKTSVGRVGFGEGSYDRAYLQGGNFCVKCGAWRGQLGLEPHPQMYIDHLVKICRGIKRVLKFSGSFWLNLGDTYCSSGKWVNKKLGDIGKQNRSVEGGAVDAYSMRGKLKPDGGWIQPKQLLGIPWRVATALQHDGWILRNAIIWHKPNHMPSSVKDRLTSSYEHVFLFAKAQRYYFDLDAIRKPYTQSGIERSKYSRPDWRGIEKEKGKPKDGWLQTKGNPLQEIISLNPRGKNPGDVWRIPTRPFPGAHFAVFPPKLIEPIIKAGCPEKGTVLDPFAGSGTVGQVARRLGRRFILIEINPEYCKMANQRVRGRYRPIPDNVSPLTEILTPMAESTNIEDTK